MSFSTPRNWRYFASNSAQNCHCRFCSGFSYALFQEGPKSRALLGALTPSLRTSVSGRCLRSRRVARVPEGDMFGELSVCTKCRGADKPSSLPGSAASVSGKGEKRLSRSGGAVSYRPEKTGRWDFLQVRFGVRFLLPAAACRSRSGCGQGFWGMDLFSDRPFHWLSSDSGRAWIDPGTAPARLSGADPERFSSDAAGAESFAWLRT